MTTIQTNIPGVLRHRNGDFEDRRGWMTEDTLGYIRFRRHNTQRTFAYAKDKWEFIPDHKEQTVNSRTPQPGNRITLTITGTVQSNDAHILGILIDGEGAESGRSLLFNHTRLNHEGTKIEVLRDPLPDKVGTVLRGINTGDKYMLTGRGWINVNSGSFVPTSSMKHDWDNGLLDTFMEVKD